MTDEELERVAKAVLDKLLDAPQGVEIVLRASGAKPSHALLPGVPRAGEVVWHCPRRNSAPRPFIVRRVEWWNVAPHVEADVFIEALPEESELAREVRALPHQRVRVKRGKGWHEHIWIR
jgi:hypothetical protein